MDKQSLRKFVSYADRLQGDEKGEAQVFCDRFFQAFGHEGYKEAGATLEDRIQRKGYHTKFADLVWKPRMLLEMKKRGENLGKYYQQIVDYWQTLVPNRPRYVISCNFDEFWIYDFDQQMDEPIDVISIKALPERASAFNFMLPTPKPPIFQNNRIEVTKEAAGKVASIFNMLIDRKEDRERAQRFMLQCVIAMFSEDVGLLPENLFLSLLEEARKRGNTYDLLGGLFNQMNTRTEARGGRYAKVPYFNGGLFAKVEPIDLKKEEIDCLYQSAQENWSKVNPAIFGTIFQNSMEKRERHAAGAHYTSESDIQNIVVPTIIRPWQEQIDAADTLKELLSLIKKLHAFRVLDPACGSGNFLYTAFRELRRVELNLLSKIYEKFGGKPIEKIGDSVSVKQFFGIEKNQFGAELAKVTLMLAKQLALKESREWLKDMQQTMHFDFEYSLPLDNLDQNIINKDALFVKWPLADAIIGNPPFQSKNKMQKEFGPAYVRKIRDAFPDVPGRADYCVYWFKKTHDCLPEQGRAGLVGTNSIRQNYSREGSLDYILSHGGMITEAVTEQAWSGDAAVRVSIVNWIKGSVPGPKRLSRQKNDGDWEQVELESINSSLSPSYDVASAKILHGNVASHSCYQGQTPGHKKFVISRSEAADMITASGGNQKVIFSYLIGEELVDLVPPHPTRYIIDFQSADILAASALKEPFQYLKRLVLPDREEAAKEEATRNQELLSASPKAKVNRHHKNFLDHWWQLSYCRSELIDKISRMNRYIACSRVTKQPIFEFVSASIRPSDALQVFTFSDDYSFGILQSSFHTRWFIAKGSSLGPTPRYTSNTVFDTFPWPQKPSPASVKKVAHAAIKLRQARSQIMQETKNGLGELYNLLELPGNSRLKEAHLALDQAVAEAYGVRLDNGILEFLLKLNGELCLKENNKICIQAPGLPEQYFPVDFTTTDCINGESLEG